MEQETRVYRVELSLYSEGLCKALYKQSPPAFCVCSAQRGLSVSQEGFSNDLRLTVALGFTGSRGLIRRCLAFFKIRPY